MRKATQGLIWPLFTSYVSRMLTAIFLHKLKWEELEGCTLSAAKVTKNICQRKKPRIRETILGEVIERQTYQLCRAT